MCLLKLLSSSFDKLRFKKKSCTARSQSKVPASSGQTCTLLCELKLPRELRVQDCLFGGVLF